jgi:hypothetical protein
MGNESLPFMVSSILRMLGIVGTLLFADITLERAKADNNNRHILLVIVAVGLIVTGFFVEMWFGIYKQSGAFDLVEAIALTVIPIWGYALGGRKGLFISAFVMLALNILFGIFLLLGVVKLAV